MLFFFNDTATTEIYTLSLHDALPICSPPHSAPAAPPGRNGRQRTCRAASHPCPAGRSGSWPSLARGGQQCTCRHYTQRKRVLSPHHPDVLRSFRRRSPADSAVGSSAPPGSHAAPPALSSSVLVKTADSVIAWPACSPSPSSAARMWASPHCSTASWAAARPSSRTSLA